MTDWIQELRDKIVHGSPIMSVKRVQVSGQVMRESEGQPAVLRRAKVFERYLDELPVRIDENPLVGNTTEHLVGVFPQPEYSCHWLPRQVTFQSQLGDIAYTDEDMKVLKEAAAYWQGRCVYDGALQAFRQVHKDGLDPTPILQAGIFGNTPTGHPLGTSLNYGKVLNQGLNQVMAEVETELARLIPGLQEDERKRAFYDAVLICLSAVSRRAGRYASLCQKLAYQETDIDKKKELLRSASALRWVPANPARNFHEAVQSFWFTYAASHMMDVATAVVPGRLGQILNPFYIGDKSEHRMGQEEAIELVELLFLRLQAILYSRSADHWQTGMGQTNVHITLGGLSPEGEDATCEMDWIMVEAQRRIRCIQPTLTVLVHDKMSQEFLLKCIEVVRDTGLGQPAFVSNKIAVQQILRNHPGATLEEARDVILHGCVPAKIAYRTDHLWAHSINLAKMLELALNNGYDPLTAAQVGPETGDADSFQCYEDVEVALKRQMEYFMSLYFELGRFSHTFTARFTPMPFQSAFIDDCIKKGKDVTEGGARYQYGAIGSPVGMIDVANSLAAIRKLVFEEKLITMARLRQALGADFRGDEDADILRMCLDAPKFGNDDIYVDEIAKKWYNQAFYDEVRRHSDSLGRPIIPHAFSISYHFSLGRHVGALPSGRRARVALTDATVSAMPGTDRHGPTALARSAARAIDATKYDCNHLNMKFHPSSLASTAGMKNFLALIKTYMDLGGFHVQFNVVAAETLKDAQLHPEAHRDLMVRVAGFSAIFVLLDREVQNEIIRRTELRL